ncbi:MAG: hypothetical protein ABW061_00960, partial [Polyangiaceae bacterium]
MPVPRSSSYFPYHLTCHRDQRASAASQRLHSLGFSIFGRVIAGLLVLGAAETIQAAVEAAPRLGFARVAGPCALL